MLDSDATGGCQRRFAFLLLFTLLCPIAVSAQTGVPSRTQCKQWDDSYVGLLNLFLLAGLLLPLIVNLVLPPLLGRRFWGLTAPRARIFYISVILGVVLSVMFVALPFAMGFGLFIFTGIEQSYFICATLKFGATGLLFGLFGEGIAAISQWLRVLILLLVACALGGLIALMVSKLLVALIGLRSQVHGGNG